jgi:uncharacterized RDD family membrane protein YckC
LARTFNIVLTGEVSQGHSREAAAAALAKLMRLTEARALELLSGKETVIKGNLDEAAVARYLSAFGPIGAGVRADPGGFWIRLLALVADIAILTVASLVVLIACSFLGAAGAKVGGVVLFLLPLLYWPLMQASGRQATYGKAMLGLKVADTGGERISWLRSFGREFAKLLSTLPLLIGFLIAAFTARKQALHDFVASTLVLREGPAHVAGAITVAVVGIVGPMIAIPMFFMAIFMAMIASIFGDFVGVMKKMPAQVTIQSPAPAASGSADADFDRLIGAPLTGFDRPGMTRVGPAILEVSTFFQMNNTLWVKVHLPRPAISEPHLVPSPLVTVDRVLDQAGENFYDPANTFERSEFFQRASLSPQSSPVAHLSGIRSVRLRPGLTEQALRKVEGRIAIILPVDPKVLAFEPAEAGREKPVHDAAVTLVSVSGGEVRLRYRGVPDHYLEVRAFGADGKAIAPEARQILSGRQPVEQQISANFKGTPARIETVVAARLVERSYPFSVAKAR